jgi:hypothetical protein
VTEAVGLDFTHDAGPEEVHRMPRIVGSGAAVLDADGDGRLDLYLLNNGGPAGKPNRLYLQTADGKFRDATDASGLGVTGFCMGAAVGDVNGDGRPDVVLTAVGSLRLFLNAGGGKFVPDGNSGLSSPLWSTSACLFDFDRDGKLDVVVTHYVDYDPSWPCTSPGGVPDFCAPKVFPGTVTKLFRNRGTAADPPTTGPKLVRFEDVTVASGIGKLPGPGLGVVCADFDGDGWDDILVANDGQPNRLWINHRDGTFTEEGIARGVAYNAQSAAQANMGIALADYDGDGLADVYITHLTAETNVLWKQGPRGLFRDRTAAAGLLATRWRGTGFGVVPADLDCDGWPDLTVANGRVSMGTMRETALGSFWAPYAERNQVLVNDGTGKFRDTSEDHPAFCGTPNVARGLIAADFDGDGGPDLLVTTVAGKAHLLRNVAPNRGHWLAVQAVLPAEGGRDAIGAEVTLRAGGRSRWGLCQPGGSYLCSGDPRAHFGLGEADRYDGVVIRWPDGTTEEFPGGPADRVVVLARGAGKEARP